MDLHRWICLLLKAGIAILFIITISDAGSKQSRRTPAHKLAQQTGAAHYEERYEKVIPNDKKSHRLRKRASDEDVDYEVYQGVVGRPGIDFPILPRIPQTTFSCRTFGNGYFADLETDCQVFHICEEGRKISFLCPNGTIFQQSDLTCDWWFKVNCASSPGHYAESSEMLIRAQNRRKQKVPQTKNEFYSSESSSRERVTTTNHKNSYPYKTSTKSSNNPTRRRNQYSNQNHKRFDSEEIPSAESLDFEDVSSNSASQEHTVSHYSHKSNNNNNNRGSISFEHKPTNSARKAPELRKVNEKHNDKIINSYDSSDEMQEPAESTFFGSSNRKSANSNNRHNDVKENGYIYGKPKDNGYVYENPNKSRKNNDREGKQRNGSNRNQNKYENEYKRASKSKGQTSSSVSEEEKFVSEAEYRKSEQEKKKQDKTLTTTNFLINVQSDKYATTVAPNNLINGLPNRLGDNGKTETTKQTPFYTPTIPTILKKSTTKAYYQKPTKLTTEKFTATTTRKPAVSYNVFNFQTKTTTEQPISSEATTDFTTTARNVFEIGHRNGNKDDLTAVNQVLPDKYEKNTKATQRSNKARTFSTTEYPETTTTFYSTRRSAQRFTTTTDYSSIEQSTSGPTYLPKETTTFRTSSAGPTYLPSTTTRPSTNVPTYMPRESTTIHGSTNGATYLPTTPYPTSTGGPTYLPQETSTFRTTSAGPTYLPQNDVTTYRPSVLAGSTNQPTTTIRPSTNGATYLPTPSIKIDDAVSEHVMDMIRTINDLKINLNVDTKNLEGDANEFLNKPPRPGLEIPPSSGPETLVSLASYFAGEELASVSLASRQSSTEPVNVAKNISIDAGLLSNRTVVNYESLFGLSTSTEPTNLPDILSPEFNTRNSNDLEAQHTSGLLGDAIGKPETRKIAQVFTNALSAYLEDPDSFRQVLSEVRPTEPPIHLEAAGAPASRRKPSVTTKPEFNIGTGATYLPTLRTTTMLPPTATTNNEELEVLDFSDVTSKTKNRVKLRPTTEYNLGHVTSNEIKTKPIARFSFGVSSPKGKTETSKTTTTDSNDIAAEINKELKLSTTRPIPLSFDLIAPEINTASTTNQPDGSTTLSDNFAYPIGPITGTGKPYIPSLSAELLPPGFSDDDDELQRAQSQSFVAARNELNNNIKADRIGKAKKDPLHSEPLINRIRANSGRSKIIQTTTNLPDLPNTTTESQWTKITQSVYLDPLTINAGLMDKFRTTTNSPFTYLPTSTSYPTSTTTDLNPTHIELTSMFANIKDAEPTILSRTSKTFSEFSSELLPPTDGMQKIANQMFGGLNDTAADHLMNVMKKAETNSMARRLILLLIQTCDEDYSKTVEQSRQALLNALIGMDNKYSFDDEVEVIKLKPRRQKSISVLNRSANLIRTTTNRVPVTTYRRSIESTTKNRITTTVSPPTSTTTDSSSYTTSFRPEETTRFEIRVEDPEELSTTAPTEKSNSWETKTTTNYPESSTTFKSRRRTTTQMAYTTTDLPSTTITTPTTTTPTTTIEPVISTTIKSQNPRAPRHQFRIVEFPAFPDELNSKQGSKKKAKDIQGSVGNSIDINSHKNSDERALELLKSLYSLASKFAKR